MIIKCHILCLLPTLACTQTQINTATSSLKCTSPPCFPLPGSVPVRTMAQNFQSAGSAGDGLSDSNNFPAWLEMCLLYLYHYAALPASFTTTKQSCSYSMWARCIYLGVPPYGVCAATHPPVCFIQGVEKKLFHKRGISSTHKTKVDHVSLHANQQSTHYCTSFFICQIQQLLHYIFSKILNNKTCSI